MLFLSLTKPFLLPMLSKCTSDASNNSLFKKGKWITIDNELDIVKRAEKGGGQWSIGRTLHLSHTTVSMIIEDYFITHMNGSTPFKSTVITKHCSLIIETKTSSFLA